MKIREKNAVIILGIIMNAMGIQDVKGLLMSTGTIVIGIIFIVTFIMKPFLLMIMKMVKPILAMGTPISWNG